VLPIDALGVDPKQHFDAVPCPFGDLGRGNSAVEPQRKAGMPQIVDPPGERGFLFLGRERGLPRTGPRAPVGDSGQLSATDSGEQASVRRGAEFFEVLAEQID